jgi:hypothetical protein
VSPGLAGSAAQLQASVSSSCRKKESIWVPPSTTAEPVRCSIVNPLLQTMSPAVTSFPGEGQETTGRNILCQIKGGATQSKLALSSASAFVDHQTMIQDDIRLLSFPTLYKDYLTFSTRNLSSIRSVIHCQQLDKRSLAGRSLSSSNLSPIRSFLP